MGFRNNTLFNTARTYLVHIKSEYFQEISTDAPPFSKFENSIIAFFLSRSVFPIKVPRPSPDLFLNFFIFDAIYGSPIILNTSFGNPGPSSVILIFISSLLLIKFMKTFFLENLTAFPTKLRIP